MPDELSVNTDAGSAPVAAPPALSPDQVQAAAQTQPPTTPQPPTAQPAEPGSVWKSVVVGALKGIEGHLAGAAKGFVQGGVPGAIGGAIDPQRATAIQQHQQAQLKFQDPASAELVARAGYYDAQTAQLPKELQMQHEARDQEMVKYLMGLGLTPTAVAENHTDGAMAGLQQAAQANGGTVPPLAIFHLGSQIVAFDLNSMGANNAILKQVNSIGGIIGRPELTLALWNKIPKGQQNQIINEATHFFNPVFPGSDKVDGTIQQYKNYLAKVNLDAAFPDKESVVAKLKNAISGLQDAKQANQASKIELARARGEAFNASKPVKVQNAAGEDVISTVGKSQGQRAGAGGAMFFGADQAGRQVAGTQAELEAAGVKSVSKLPDAEKGKVVNARQMIAPDGLFQATAAAIKSIGDENMNPVINHWKEFMAGKYATDPKFAQLRNNIRLISSQLMQVHVGARGSEGMLYHFNNLADYSSSDARTLKAALAAEYNYVHERAMVPQVAK